MFRFKQFTIHQDRCAMKVGTDGVLLGAWADVHDKTQVLDIGTGTGLIALMMAQRNPNALVDAIEIDADAAKQARQNASNSPFHKNIAVHETPLHSFETERKYDLIISNPPFFSNVTKNSNNSKSTARHDDLLSSEEILLFSKKHLTENGALNVIYPIENAEKMIQQAENNGLLLTRKCTISPTPEKPAHRMMLTFEKEKKDCVHEKLIIEDKGRHGYSSKYIELTKAFYLNF